MKVTVYDINKIEWRHFRIGNVFLHVCAFVFYTTQCMSCISYIAHLTDGMSLSTPGSSSYLFKILVLNQIDEEHCSYVLGHE